MLIRIFEICAYACIVPFHAFEVMCVIGVEESLDIVQQ